MPNLEQLVDFNPERDGLSLSGKVIFVTGGTAGLGRACVLALAKHNPAFIYFSGRNVEAGKAFISEVQASNSRVGLKFVEMDMESLASVKNACSSAFQHHRLDILMCNAGVMYIPPGVSKDGYEKHFAINHLAHALMIQLLLPTMERTAMAPDSDVRVVSLSLSSIAWMAHPRKGITFSTLQTPQTGLMGARTRYGQSKLANIVYTSELARRYSQSNIKFVSVHPGFVRTDLTSSVSMSHKLLNRLFFLFVGASFIEVEQGCLSQLWAAAGGKKENLINGGFYMPVGRLSNDRLDKTAKSKDLGTKLWKFTESALSKV